MTNAERREAVRQFINRWQGRGNENQDARSYWIEIFTDILGIDDVTQRVEFEKPVYVDGHKRSIDVYVPETHVLIEQKSLGIALDKPSLQSGGDMLTPYGQAKRYNDNLPYNEKARWIITSNFAEIWIYDMDAQIPEPFKLTLVDLQNKYPKLDLLVKEEVKKLTDEMAVSIKAGELVGLLYDAFAKQFGDMENEQNQKSLNVLCVRLVFCLYAEDAEIFERKDQFHDYLEHYEPRDMRMALINLFKVLNTPKEERDPFLEKELAEFPYVNGGLFDDDNPIIPPITDEIKTLLLEKAALDFDWSDISPTIFGAVFESTLNPETRRKGGMHYTSIENIHKVIDPLFLDNLDEEMEDLVRISSPKKRILALDAFQNKLAGMRFFDPACGSGNFLTETYLSLRKLENEVLKEKEAARKGSMAGQISFGDLGKDTENPIKVSIQQFYGIEINDFACTVAKTALWIAESQMMKQTEDVLHMDLNFLPLKSYVNMAEGNALRMDWNDVLPAYSCSFLMGNPPFIGHQWRTKEQAEDMSLAFHDLKTHGKLDYVSAWYNIATDYMKLNPKIKTAFVSTNSICQGEAAVIMWEHLRKKGVNISFAYRTFVWDSEATDKAHVHCVIVGFELNDSNTKWLFEGDNKKQAEHINGYLVDAPDTYIKSRGNCLTAGNPSMFKGSQPTDGSYLLLDEQEKENFDKNYPDLRDLIKPYMGSYEFINNKRRYCLWLKGVSPNRYVKNPFIIERLKGVVASREKSATASVRKDAATPALFTQIRQPDCDYLAFPAMSSSRRRYMPIGYITKDVIASNQLYVLPSATLYMFGVLTSNIHMAWMRTVCGRLKSDYRYAPAVYNNFPWPTPTVDQKAKIEQTAQAILDARAMYPESSLADLYDPLTMPPELSKAHTANDKAVMAAYGFSTKMTEAECVAELMKMYQKLSE